jgi:hypothetical protein
MYNKGPFASWVPKPIMLLLIAIILVPMIAIMGVYTGNATDISGALSMYTEYVSMANNATTIGMGLAIAIALRIKMRFRTKEIVAGCSIILAVLSFMNGTTDNPNFLVIGSLLIGFFKMFPLFEMVLPVMFILSPSGDKGKFYAIFYPISIGFGQASSFLMSKLMYYYSWQTPFFVMSIIMLFVALVSLIFQHNQRFCYKMPLYQLDWLSLVLIATSGLSISYSLVFMKQQGWFSSPSIVSSLVLGLVLMLVAIYRQRFLKRKLIKFDFFYKSSNVLHGLLLLLFLGIYLASSSILIQYSSGILDYSPYINAKLNLWMLPGIIISGVIAFFSFKNKWSIKLFILMGFAFMFLHILVLYLIIQPQMDITYLKMAVILKGVGMGSLFIGIWFYATLNLPMEDMIGVVSMLFLVRSFLSTAIGGALITWATYKGQWQSLSDISMQLDVGAFANGMAIYQSTVISSLISSLKIVLGAICWLSIPITIFILSHHYGKFKIRRLVLFRKRIVGDSTKGYKLR